MPRKPIDLPPAAARAFVKDMHAFFAESNKNKADEIAIRQLVAPEQISRPAGAAASSHRRQRDVPSNAGRRMTVWVYINTAKQVGARRFYSEPLTH